MGNRERRALNVEHRDVSDMTERECLQPSWVEKVLWRTGDVEK